MRRIFELCYRHAFIVITCVLALTGLAFWQSTQIAIDVSSETLIPKNSELKLDYEKVKKQFGSDRLAIIYAESTDLFSNEKLAALQELSKTLQKLPQIQRIDSLFSINNIRGENGWVNTSPLLKRIPQGPKKLEAKKAEALDNPLLINSIISADATATLLTLHLVPQDSSDPDTLDAGIYEKIETELANYTTHFDQLYQVGTPALNVWMSDYIFSDQKVLLPLSAFILIILIGLLMRNVQAALIPLLNALLSTVWTIGLMALFGIPINMLNYIVPALVLIIGATEDVHILTEFRQARSKGLSLAEAVPSIADHIGLTLLLTGLTTTLGFAVTSINDLTIMQHFGLSATIGMFTRFLVSIVFLPAYLRFGGRYIKASQKTNAQSNSITERVAPFLSKYIISHPIKLITIFIAIGLPALWMIPQIKVSNNLIGFLQKDSPIVQKLENVSEKLCGNKVIYLTLKGDPGDFKSAQKIKKLEAITKWIRKDERADTVTSLSDYLSLVNQAMFGSEEYNRAPKTDALVAQYLIFFHRSDLKPYVTGDYSTANIAIRCNLNESQALNQWVREIEEKIGSGAFGRFSFSITGQSVLVAAAVEKIVIGQVISLSGMLLLLFIVIAVLFISGKAALLSVVANLFPVILVFGVMGWADLPLNVGTCMVAAITLGIAVDDTLHLMLRYNKELKRLKNELLAIQAAIKAEFSPVLITSLALAGGFIVLASSSFVPIKQFGILSALVIIGALLTDIVLTPALLSQIRLITLWDIMSLNLRKALLEQSPMFSGMTKLQAKKLILLANIEDYAAGSRIITEGEIGQSMYVVLEGNLEVSKNIDGQKIILSQLQLGEVFGEIALVSQTKRTADVIAETPAKALVLDWESLTKLQRSSPYLSSRLFLNLAKILGLRVKSTQQRIDTRPPFPEE